LTSTLGDASDDDGERRRRRARASASGEGEGEGEGEDDDARRAVSSPCKSCRFAMMASMAAKNGVVKAFFWRRVIRAQSRARDVKR
jgi:hypothetical protein